MIDRRPRPASARVAVAIALLAAAGLAGFSLPALGVGLAGAVVIAAGLARGRGGWVTLGAVGLVAGVFAAGQAGAPAGVTALGTVAVVVAWDAAWRAVTLGRQLGRDARAGGLEARRIGTTAVVGTVAGALGYAIYVPATAGQPVAAVAALLVAVVLLVAAID